MELTGLAFTTHLRMKDGVPRFILVGWRCLIFVECLRALLERGARDYAEHGLTLGLVAAAQADAPRVRSWVVLARVFTAVSTRQ
jgi:hypothetical protein